MAALHKQTKDLSRFWRAIKRRQRNADANFVYAVRSTRIYCRPSCPAKRPRFDRVVYFRNRRQAELAGYRACRRCWQQESSLRQSAQFVQRICRKIEETLASNPETTFTLNELGGAYGLKTHKIGRLFNRTLGITPRQFIDARRMAQLKSNLRKGEQVTSAMYDAGFGSSSRLYERAPAQMGMTPAVYRRGGEGMSISYAIVPCTLGKLLVAATARGVSAVYLGNSDKPLEQALAKEYPRAEIRRESKRIAPWVRGVLGHLRGQEPHSDLPLDVQATAFQRRVWKELQRIPYGSTKTYTEVARAIGKPRSIRAVARACATNPVSIVVPCHRVVRADGNLAGYRWGLERKEMLLAAEKSRRDMESSRSGRNGR